MKSITILVFTCLLNLTSIGQSDVFQIIDSLKYKVSNSLFDIGEIEVFPIEIINVSCKKYEVVEVSDSIYEAKLKLINSLVAEEIELKKQLKTFNEDVQELVNAEDYLDQFNRDPAPSLMFKWQYIKNAQESLDKTSHKIDLYRSKTDVFNKSGGKTPYKIGSYVLKLQGQIHDIIHKGSFLKSKTDNLSRNISDVKNELKHINKTKKVNMSTGMMIRSIKKVDNISIGKEIKGRFVKEEGYTIMSKEYQHFIVNELILKDTLLRYTNEFEARRMSVMCDQYNYVIKDIETGKMYYTTGDIIRRWCISSYLADLFTSIDNLRIKRQTIDGKVLLSYNGFQCVLTADIADALIGNNPTCIQTMNYSVNKYNEYNKLASDLAVKLASHIKLYKSRLIKSGEIEAWKKDTKECDAILTKMRDLPYADSRAYYDQLDEKQVGLHTTTLDYVSYSKSKLGL